MKDYKYLLEHLENMFLDSDEPCDRCILMQAKNAIEDLLANNKQNQN